MSIMRRQTSPQKLVLPVLGIALFTVALTGCAKTDYSDTNAPAQSQANATSNGNAAQPHGMGRGITTMAVPVIKKQGS